MDDAEKLLRNWRQSPPRTGVRCEDALKVIQFLGMRLKPVPNSQGHYHAFHAALQGSDRFRFGAFTVNCHAFGVQGQAHPRAVQDILKAAKIIQDANQDAKQKAQASDEDDTDEDSPDEDSADTGRA